MRVNYSSDKLYIDRVQELDSIQKEKSGNSSFPLTFNKIEFKDLSFSFHNKNILSSVNLTLERGRIYTIIGRSGIGKTTVFIGLLSLLYNDYNGEIRIGDINIKELDLQQIRTAITTINQEPYMFTGSIKRNIVKFLQKVPMQKIVAITTQFGINIDSEKIITEKGSNISIGEKQRIAFVRSILRDSDIYIFDEVTSAQDLLNKNKII